MQTRVQNEDKGGFFKAERVLFFIQKRSEDLLTKVFVRSVFLRNLRRNQNKNATTSD